MPQRDRVALSAAGRCSPAIGLATSARVTTCTATLALNTAKSVRVEIADLHVCNHARPVWAVAVRARRFHMVERDAGLFDAAQVHGRHIMLARAAHMVRSEQARRE